jgi:hypothetical protein
MLHLDELGKHLRDKPVELQGIYSILVGTIFSLWRAVFLIRTERSFREEVLHADALLGILIETNAVGFPQDVATAQWTAGYYVNNAALRLFSISQNRFMREYLSEETLLSIGGLSQDRWTMINLVGLELAPLWEEAFQGFDMVLHDACEANVKLERMRAEIEGNPG